VTDTAKTSEPRVRTGQGSTKLTREEFERRWRERFYHPIFEADRDAVDRLAALAWQAYDEGTKSPRTRKAGPEFADSDFDLPLEWLDARRRVRIAADKQREEGGSSRVLIVCGSPRTDETCPGEMSKTFRLVQEATQTLQSLGGHDIDVLDLSEVTAAYGRTIHPCKACVSTAMPLCHWPCSCYPNHATGQVNDWMHEIYPRWVQAHGIMIVTPVHWYQTSSVLKLMIDRLVCADGGNPDPTTTGGKKPEKAKALELQGWHYPKHLAGRVFSVVVHGDTVGAEGVRRALHDWLIDLELIPAAGSALLDRYIGYYEPYATSHDALDRDTSLIEEVKNAARALSTAIGRRRAGERPADEALRDPRPK
jgi:multimeric flavodoxin WrbA